MSLLRSLFERASWDRALAVLSLGGHVVGSCLLCLGQTPISLEAQAAGGSPGTEAGQHLEDVFGPGAKPWTAVPGTGESHRPTWPRALGCCPGS